jgi:HEAT repeat protein
MGSTAFFRRLFLLLALSLPALLAPSAAALGQDGTLADFRRLFPRFKESADRVEAIKALKGLESPELVEVLTPLLLDGDTKVADAARGILAGFKTPAPVESLFQRALAEKKLELRAALLWAAAEGRYPPPEAALEKLSKWLTDKQWTLRRRVLQLLAPHADEAGLNALLPLLNDPEPAVRISAFDALAERRHAPLLEPALAALSDPDWQVRASAIAALVPLRDKRSVGPLIDCLLREEGRLREDAVKALRRLTGRDFGLDGPAWKRFWDGMGERFELPTEEELQKREAARAEERAKYNGSPSFLGVDTPSRSILFVIDVSGSMETLFVNRAPFGDKVYPSWSRMDVVKTELKATVLALDENTRFEVVAFAGEVIPWRKQLVPANKLQRLAAVEWIDKLQPIGGQPNEDMARAGIAPSPEQLKLGKTNTFGALMYSIGARDAAGKPVPEGGYRLEVDTVYFLSDGQPSVGEFTDPDDIRKEVAKANELRRVVIHVIGMGQFQKRWMGDVARDSGGQFIDLGW